MNRYTPLLRAGQFTVERFDHPDGDVHQDPRTEVAPVHSISLVERGGFSIGVGKQSWELQAGDIFLTYPGMEYRCRHRETVAVDSCLVVSYPAGADRETDLSGLMQQAQERAVLPATNQLAYLFRRICFCRSEPMASESAAEALLRQICCPIPPRRIFRRRQLAWYAERVDAARACMEQHPCAPHSLDSLARSVGMSRFHFSRVFSELTGTPPHRYLLEARMRAAARQLREGASVTEACFSSGFQNFSHFIRMFRRRFGITPSGVRRTGRFTALECAGQPGVRKMRGEEIQFPAASCRFSAGN